jgi:hypothetical protein
MRLLLILKLVKIISGTELTFLMALGLKKVMLSMPPK